MRSGRGKERWFDRRERKRVGLRARGGQAEGRKAACSFTACQDERTKVKVIASMRSTPRALARRVHSRFVIYDFRTLMEYSKNPRTLPTIARMEVWKRLTKIIACVCSRKSQVYRRSGFREAHEIELRACEAFSTFLTNRRPFQQ